MIMKNFHIFCATIFCSLINFNAQSFLNGSFENTTSSGCDYNLPNGDFNGKMQKTIAYGSPGEVDIQRLACSVATIPDGNVVISLNARANNSGVDAVSLELTTPLITGISYKLTFKALANTTFNPAIASIKIGCSTTSTNLSSPTIYTPVLVAGQWVSYSVDFVAPNNGKFITIIPEINTGPQSAWTTFDAFGITPTLSTVETENSASVKIFPNPARDFIKVSGLSTALINYSIVNSAGQKVMKGSISDNTQIDVQKLATGLYFLLLENGSKIKFLKD